MACERNPCVTPLCKGAAWIASSCQPDSVKAFHQEVVDEMRRTGSRDAGKVAARVFARAQAGECVFG